MSGTITVNGDAIVWHPGMTISDVLAACNFVFPLLVINVNGTLIEREHYDRTEVPEGAVVSVVHLMSGG